MNLKTELCVCPGMVESRPFSLLFLLEIMLKLKLIFEGTWSHLGPQP